MSLARALVDRARVVDKERTGQKVDGRQIVREVTRPWFAVRLTELATPETIQAGRTRVSRNAELLYSLADENGAPVELDGDVRLEVESIDLGSEFWEVDGKPEIMRRRRGLVGGLARVKHISEPGGL